MTLTPAELNALWTEVASNQDRLNACPGHDFSIDTTPEQPLNKRYACSRCQGTLRAVEKHWYERGVAHGVLQALRG